VYVYARIRAGGKQVARATLMGPVVALPQVHPSQETVEVFFIYDSSWGFS